MDFGGAQNGSGVGRPGSVDRDKWLSQILFEALQKCGVVLVDGTFQKPPKKPRREPLKPSGSFSGGGDDDDCVVLEGDRDKLVVAAPTPKSIGVKVDDVVIVAEKGEVACRDFPHARHLCAKYRFASTRHEIHCSLCYCYVCDSVAPCLFWGTGLSSSDHCHATDKDEYWLAERKRIMKGLNPAPVVARPLLAQLGPLAHYPIGLPPVAPVYMPQPAGRPVSKNPISNPAPAVTPLINNTTLARPLLAQTPAPRHHQVRAPVAPVYRPQPTTVGKNPISKLHNVRPLGSQLLKNGPVSEIKKKNGSVSEIKKKNGPVSEIKKMPKERHCSSTTHTVHSTACQRSTGTRFSNSSAYTAYENSRSVILPNQSAGNNSGNQFSQPQAQVYSNKHQGAGSKKSIRIKGPVDNFQQGSFGSYRVVAPLERVHTSAHSSSKRRP